MKCPSLHLSLRYDNEGVTINTNMLPTVYRTVQYSPIGHHNPSYRDAVDHPISYLDTLVKTGSESIEATLRRRRILFAGFVACMEDTRLPKSVMFGEMVGRAGCVGGQEKEWMGCFLDDLSQSFRHQRRPVDDYSPGLGEMAQNGRTRGGIFHGKMDCCRKTQGWPTACSGMPERDGKDQGEDSPKQTCSCWFARPC